MSTTPQERLESDLKAAMKAGEKERVATLRMLLADVKNARIEAGDEVSEETFIGLVRRGIKQRREAAEQYEQGGRGELAAKEEREAEILQTYLPEQIDEEEARRRVREVIEQKGLSGPAGIGVVMGTLMPELKGRIEGQTLNRIARQELEAAG